MKPILLVFPGCGTQRSDRRKFYLAQNIIANWKKKNIEIP